MNNLDCIFITELIIRASPPSKIVTAKYIARDTMVICGKNKATNPNIVARIPFNDESFQSLSLIIDIIIMNLFPYHIKKLFQNIII